MQRLLSARFGLIAALGMSATGCPPKVPVVPTPAESAPSGAPPAPDAPQSAEWRRSMRDKLEAAFAEPDPLKKAGMLEPLVNDFPAGTQREQLKRIILQNYAIGGNIEKMEQYVTEIELGEDLSAAQIMNAMAYAYAEKGVKLSDARAHVLKALNILDQHETGGGRVRLSDDGKKQLEEARGYYLDTLGWIDVKSGKLADAQAVIEQAVQRVDLAAIRYHLGFALEKRGKLKEAANEYARGALLGGEDADLAQKALDALAGKVDIEAALKKAKADLTEERKKAAMDASVSEPAPEFKLVDTQGRAIDQVTVANGGVTVIDFWASWCAPCREEFPILQRLFVRYEKDPKVKFVVVSVDETLDAAQQFMKEGKFSLPMAHEPRGEVARKFAVEGLPTLLILGPDGRVRFRHIGFNPDLETVLPIQIDSLLK